MSRRWGSLARGPRGRGGFARSSPGGPVATLQHPALKARVVLAEQANNLLPHWLNGRRGFVLGADGRALLGEAKNTRRAPCACVCA
eukprot:15476543-Alexandrium_andersonii.AAC.1